MTDDIPYTGIRASRLQQLRADHATQALSVVESERDLALQRVTSLTAALALAMAAMDARTPNKEVD